MDQFSRSELQLLSLARALLRAVDSSIILLDDATSALDDETDRKMQKMIKKEFQDKTVITVSHRLTTAVDNDQLIIMKHGSVREVGHPASLLKDSKSHFREMISQLGSTKLAELLSVAEGRS